jgi:hypothetical protein
MPEWSRRNLLKASAGAAVVAVPMAALSTGLGGQSAAGTSIDADPVLSPEEVASLGGGQVVFSIQDAERGEVAVYHGTDEVIVKDRQLVARILRAANVRAADVTAAS